MDLALELLTATLTSPWVYLLIAVAAALDSLMPIVPSETLLITAATFAATGHPHPAGLILAAAGGALLGDLAAHLVGRFAATGVGRWRRWARIANLLDSAHTVFSRRGGTVLIAGRFVPGGRSLATIGSGLLGFPIRTFLLWDGIGSLAWALYSTAIGLIGGMIFEDRPLLGVAVGIGIALAITGSAELIRRLRRRRRGHTRHRFTEFQDRDVTMAGMSQTYVWYVSYGSNMARDRLACYLQGGRPPGAMVTYPGARDATLPRAEAGIELPGTIYFAGESKVWGGGMAFYDHFLPGPTPAKAYLITAEQFADVAAQEMHRPPEPDSPLERLVFDLAAGSSHSLGPGGYETLLVLDDVDGVPMVTFTAAHRSSDVEHAQPQEPYLAMLRTGIAEVRAASGLPLPAAAQV
ncbi:DedA family protein [Brevibacterium sp. CSND-B09]|uniref:DedA family protein n=1 Tax=Brevibacterium sp. CSND-B09 TaxID=3462571 RepID=UPI00406A6522